MLFIDDGDEIMLAALPGELFVTEDSKDLLVQFIGGLLRRSEAKRFGLLLNAWMLPGYSKNREDAEAQFSEWRGHFHEHPDRQEVLNLMVADAEQAQVWMAQIKRNETKPPTLAEWEQSEHAEGRFMDLADILKGEGNE